MHAKDLVKKSKTIDQIYKQIEAANMNGEYKCFIPHFIYVDPNIKLQLVEDGFKIHVGDWDSFMKDSLIIEW